MKQEIKFRGNRLKALMNEKGWTTKNLIEQLNPYSESIATSSRQAENWLNGSSKPRIDTLLAICDLFNCTPDYLLGFDDCTNKNYQFIANETGLTESAINHFHSRLKRTGYHCPASVGLNKSEKKEFEKAISEKERKDIDSFNQVLCRIDLMGFCTSLLEYAQSESKLSNTKEYWEGFNAAISKGTVYKKTPPKDLISYTDYTNFQEKQAYKMYLLKEELSKMVDLLTQSLIEYPVKND